MSNLDPEECKYKCANDNCSETVYIKQGVVVRREGEHTCNRAPARASAVSRKSSLLVSILKPIVNVVDQAVPPLLRLQPVSNPTALEPAGIRNVDTTHPDVAGESVRPRTSAPLTAGQPGKLAPHAVAGGVQHTCTCILFTFEFRTNIYFFIFL